MIKIIQYIHGTSWDLLLPAAVAAWSVKQRACLPGKHELIFYTTSPENLDNPFLHKVFDEVRFPTIDWQKIWNIDWQQREDFTYERNPLRKQIVWTNYIQWLETPCEDDDYVIYGDYDLLCVGSLAEALPTAEEGKLWAGRTYYSHMNGEERLATNGGFYIKRGLFNRTMLVRQLQEAFWDTEKHDFALRELSPHLDESDTAYFIYKHGDSTLKHLDERFNYWDFEGHIKTRKTLEQRDIRMVHFIGNDKPWGSIKKPYRKLYGRWHAAYRQMMQEIGPWNL